MAEKLSVCLFAPTQAARQLADLLPYRRLYSAAQLKEAFLEGNAIVGICPIALLVRILGPYVGKKAADPPVVCVDPASKIVAPVLGLHRRYLDESGCLYMGASDLAKEVASVIGAVPAFLSATESAGLLSPDLIPGYLVEGDVAAAAQRILEGDTLTAGPEGIWPVPLKMTPAQTEPDCLISYKASEKGSLLTLRPPCIYLGIGLATEADPEAAVERVIKALEKADIHGGCIAGAATIATRAEHPAFKALCNHLSIPALAYPASELAAVSVPSPSVKVKKSVGTASVAEAAALLAAGKGAALLLKKQILGDDLTLAAAVARPRGLLSVVGIGPGATDLLTLRAISRIRGAAAVLGYEGYLEQIRELLSPTQVVLPYSLGEEERRTKDAVSLAQRGYKVALVSSGDSNVFGMGERVAQILPQIDAEVEFVPGITAALALAARAGAGLRDLALVSLSDIHEDSNAIKHRVKQAASSGFSIALYNPRSSRRRRLFEEVLDLLRESLGDEAPTVVGRLIERRGQEVKRIRLKELDPEQIDMFTCLIVSPPAGSQARNAKA